MNLVNVKKYIEGNEKYFNCNDIQQMDGETKDGRIYNTIKVSHRNKFGYVTNYTIELYGGSFILLYVNKKTNSRTFRKGLKQLEEFFTDLEKSEAL